MCLYDKVGVSVFVVGGSWEGNGVKEERRW